MKRSGKFYRTNEKVIMKRLGLKPTKGSGCGWIEKEDGSSEDILCQLKSTDKESIKINRKDIHTLIYNSIVEHKIPIFVIQFINSEELYIISRVNDLDMISKYISNREKSLKSQSGVSELYCNDEEVEVKEKPTIKSNSKERDKFREENEKRFKKNERKAK